MIIGVLSDTHGHVEFATRGIEALRKQDVQTVLHCGDIGSTEIVELLDGFDAHFVFGNVDWDKDGLRAEIKACGQQCHGEFGSLEVDSRQIALLHSHDRSRFEETISGQSFDLVCYGHTHKAEKHKSGRTVVLNPGALYRAAFHSVAVVDLESMSIEHITVGDD